MTVERDEQLAKFHAELLEILSEQKSLDEIRSRLESNEAFGPYRDYTETFETRMIEVAVALVRKWGRRVDDQYDDPAAHR
jgi:hypothetical protein